MAEGGRETEQLSVSDAESADSEPGETMEPADPSQVLTPEDSDTGNDVMAMAAPPWQPRSGEVWDTDQRQMVHRPNLSLEQQASEKGDNTQTASGRVDMKVEGNSGVVKGIEQHVYQGCTFIVASSPGDLQALTQGAASPFLQMSPSVDLPALPAPPVPSLLSPPPPAPLPQAPEPAELQPSSSAHPQQRSSQQQSSQQQSSQQQPSQPQSSQQQSSLQQSSLQQSSLQQSSQQQPSQLQPSPPPSSPPPPQAASMVGGEGGAPGRQSPESQTAASPRVPPAACPHLPEESKKLKNLIANTKQHMATACPQGYVETLALGELEEELEDSGVCLVLGLPGHGKTALALQAMGRLAASHQFKPMWLTKPEQWGWIPGEGEESRNAGTQDLKHPHPHKEIRFKASIKESQSSENTAGCSYHLRSQDPSQEGQDSRRYIVLLDDLFGKGHHDAAKKKAWEEVFDLVLAKVKAKQVKVILVSRADIYEECKKSLSGHQLFEDVKTIDLREIKYWTVSDKKAILKNFLQEKRVCVDEPIEKFIQASESCTQIGFPQVCRFFASEKHAQRQGPDFFRKPLQFLHKQLDQMQKNDIKSYLVLILTWLEGGILSGEYLAVDNTYFKRRISEVCEHFDVKDVMTIREVQTKARSLCGVYLSEDEEGSFRFTHQSICDSLVVAMCSFDLKRALDVCSIQQVCEYVRTEESAEDQLGMSYTVPKSKWPLLAARLVKAMTSKELLVALDHPSLQDEEFVSVFVDKHLTVSHMSQLMYTVCRVHIKAHFFERRGYNFFREAYHILRCIFHHLAPLTTTSIASALIKRQSALADHFLREDVLSSLPEVEVCKHLREALQTACHVSNEALVTDLLERRAEVTPDTVRAACESENDNIAILRMVTKRLPRIKLCVNLYSDLLWACCMSGKIRSLEYLLTEARIQYYQEPLDQVLTRLVWESQAKDIWLPRRCIERLPELFSLLKIAGARLDKTEVAIRFAAGHPYAFALKEHLAGKNDQDVSTVFADGSTLLHEAAEHGSLECLQTLMDSPATKNLDVNAVGSFEQTPLSLAVEENHVEALEFLLKHGADPNIGRISSRRKFVLGRIPFEFSSPLNFATARHSFSAMELLLQHNVRTDVTDKDNRTPLHLYAAGTQRHSLDEVKKEIQQSCAKQRAEELLLAKTSDINQKDAGGCTPLHLACQASQTSLVRKLLSKDARVDMVDNQGKTVLHILADSAQYKNGEDAGDEMVEMIVETYQSQQTKEVEDARGKGNVNMQDWVNSTDKEGRTPLHLAAERGNLPVVKALLKHKASTEIQDNRGWTPLHAAASSSHTETMDVLTAHGANPDAEDNLRRIPRDVYVGRLPKAAMRRCHKPWHAEPKAFQNEQNTQDPTILHILAKGVFDIVTGGLRMAGLGEPSQPLKE